MNMEHLAKPPMVISDPSRVPPVQRTFWGAVTALCWAVYAYLWLPLITLVLWLLGIRRGYGEIYLRENSIDPFVLTVLPIFALVTVTVLFTWAEYNRLRFRGQDRRQPMHNVPLKQIAVELGASAELAERMQHGKIMVLQMNPEAIPIGMTEPPLALRGERLN